MQSPTIKKYKYEIPEEVSKCFSNNITEVLYKGNLYRRDLCYFLHQQGVLEEDIIDKYLIEYKDIIRNDFKEVFSKNDIFNNTLKQFSEQLKKYLSTTLLTDDDIYLITVFTSTYNNFIFSIDKDGKIFKVTDNCAYGINSDIEKFLKNKQQNISDFKYTFQKVKFHQIFEEVFKWYYYKEDFENSSNSGAGTLTGWLTEEEVKPRAQNHILIKLNQNFRLKK